MTTITEELQQMRIHLEGMREDHYTSEDCWYSCPAGHDEDMYSNCCDEARDKWKCDCGANQQNAIIDDMLRTLATWI
jgi:hypothetical protein